MGCTETIHTLTANRGVSDLPEQSCSLDKASIAVDDLTMIRDSEQWRGGCLTIGLANSIYGAAEFGVFDVRWGVARAMGERKVGLSPRPSLPAMNATTHYFGDVITRFSDGGAAL